MLRYGRTACRTLQVNPGSDPEFGVARKLQLMGVAPRIYQWRGQGLEVCTAVFRGFSSHIWFSAGGVVEGVLGGDGGNSDVGGGAEPLPFSVRVCVGRDGPW